MVKLLDHCDYQGKSLALQIADGLLFFTAASTGAKFNKFVKNNGSHECFTSPLVASVFARVILGVIAVVTFPITLLGLVIKKFNWEAQQKALQDLKGANRGLQSKPPAPDADVSIERDESPQALEKLFFPKGAFVDHARMVMYQAISDPKTSEKTLRKYFAFLHQKTSNQELNTKKEMVSASFEDNFRMIFSFMGPGSQQNAYRAYVVNRPKSELAQILALHELQKMGKTPAYSRINSDVETAIYPDEALFYYYESVANMWQGKDHVRSADPRERFKELQKRSDWQDTRRKLIEDFRLEKLTFENLGGQVILVTDEQILKTAADCPCASHFVKIAQGLVNERTRPKRQAEAI